MQQLDIPRWLPGVRVMAAVGFLAWFVGVGGVTSVQAYTQLGPNTKSDFRLWAPIYLTVNLPNRFLA
ncbi:MAG TPA: hypothetical protein PLO50_11615, partial [Nitrospira sp.]|nr:hypothetical protein [Nitrospira sp.]